MAKIMIASDIHGSAYYCRQMLDRFKEEKENKWYHIFKRKK